MTSCRVLIHVCLLHCLRRTQGRWDYGYGRLRKLVFRMLGCTARQDWRTCDWVWGERDILLSPYIRTFDFLYDIYLILPFLPRAYHRRALILCMSSPSAYRSSYRPSSQINNTSGSGLPPQLRDSVHLPPLPLAPAISATATICRPPFRESTNFDYVLVTATVIIAWGSRAVWTQADITVCVRIYVSRVNALPPSLLQIHRSLHTASSTSHL